MNVFLYKGRWKLLNGKELSAKIAGISQYTVYKLDKGKIGNNKNSIKNL